MNVLWFKIYAAEIPKKKNRNERSGENLTWLRVDVTLVILIPPLLRCRDSSKTDIPRADTIGNRCVDPRAHLIGIIKQGFPFARDTAGWTWRGFLPFLNIIAKSYAEATPQDGRPPIKRVTLTTMRDYVRKMRERPARPPRTFAWKERFAAGK